jgi:hypothetical protein
MKNIVVLGVLVVAAVALIGVGACACAAWLLAPRVLGAGPDGIDLRPTPGAIDAEAALPQEVGRYTRGACHPLGVFQGLDLGPDAVEAIYTGPDGQVRVIAARMDSTRDAARIVSELAGRLEDAGLLSSRRLRAEEPSPGWWSASGKRNCAYWYAADGDLDRHGFIWQSGRWCFIVSSDQPVARRDVSLDFPY